MAIRSNHYDAAFEAYLIATGRPYVAVDETRRAHLASVSLKSMDFIVDGIESRLLLDVKGRRFSVGSDQSHRWESWADLDDVESLLRWEEVFGPRYRAAFLFAYLLTDAESEKSHPVRYEYAGKTYAFYGVWVREYAKRMRQRSPKWHTVVLPSRDYQRLRQPWEEFLRV